MSRSIPLRKVIMITLGIWLAGSAVFAVLYWQRQAPRSLDTLAAAPRRLANEPPAFLGHLTVPPENALLEPLDVDAAEDGRIYVADSGNSLIRVFSEDGQYLLSFGGKGKGDGQLDYPTSVRVRNGRVYVADFRNGRIAVFSPEGRFIENFTHGQGQQPLVPLALDVDEQGQIYIADRSHQVLVLGKDGKLVRSFGQPGSEDGQLAYPNGILLRNGKVYVADSGNARVEVFSLAGKYVSKLSGFVNPRGMAVDGEGRLYVVDPLAHNVTVFSREDSRLFGFGTRGLEGGQFNFPNAIAVDGRGRVYVADRENNRISVWR